MKLAAAATAVSQPQEAMEVNIAVIVGRAGCFCMVICYLPPLSSSPKLSASCNESKQPSAQQTLHFSTNTFTSKLKGLFEDLRFFFFLYSFFPTTVPKWCCYGEFHVKC